MKDEIKEILEYVLSLTYGNENAIKGVNKVANYITNLEQENKGLKAQVKLLDDNRIYLNNKIDKAIEILNEGLEELDKRNRNEVYSEEYLENAIDTLKGSDK